MIVQHWIDYPPKPKLLYLVWQPPKKITDRSRWVVGRLDQGVDGISFVYLSGIEFELINLGRSQADLKDTGYVGYPAFDIGLKGFGPYTDRVMEAFQRRVPSSNRPDLAAYLEHFHVRPTAHLPPFSLLAVTEARLPSDGFSLVDPLDAAAPNLDVVTEIAGYSLYQSASVGLRIGDIVNLEHEPSNAKDANAVQMKWNGQLIGYVNRLQAPSVRSFLSERSVACCISRVNGSKDKPRAFAFLQVRSAAELAAA